MAVSKAITLLMRVLLKAASVWDGVRKRSKAKERARRLHEIEEAIRTDPVATANRMYGVDDGERKRD